MRSLVVLVRRTSAKSRLLLFVSAIFSVLARVVVLGVAIEIASGDNRGAILAAAIAAGLHVIERIAGASARVSVECDIHAMTARALLDADVVSVDSAHTNRTVYDGATYGLQLIAGTLPSLFADGLVALAVIPVLIWKLPSQVVGLVAMMLVVVALGIVLVRRRVAQLENEVRAEQQRLADTLDVALEARLEIVANAREEAILGRLGQELTAYRRTATRASFGSAILGRVPLVLAVLGALFVVTLDLGTRAVVETTIVGQAILLAVSLPPLFAAVVAAHTATRTLAFVRPFAELIAAPARQERGTKRPTLRAAIRAKDLGFAYEQASPSRDPSLRGKAADRASGPGKPVLSKLSFEWSGREPLVIVGPNGSGKSTLLRLILGLRLPSAGELMIGDEAISTIDLGWLRQQISFLPQRPYLGGEHFSVREAMRLASDAKDDAIRKALERTGLPSLSLESPVGELSAGQRQRVGLARILLQERPIVLLDEPDANLDRDGVKLVADLVRELSAKGVMVALVVHTEELTTLGQRLAL